MTDDEVIQLVQAAFRDVQRPESFTSCPCEECTELDERLRARDNESVKGRDFGITSLCLVSAEGIRYYMPALVQLALSRDEEANAFSPDFIDLWSTPISKREPPRSLPQTRLFDRTQTAATLAFLEHVREQWLAEDDGEEVPRELNRAVRNWRHFLACFDDEKD